MSGLDGNELAVMTWNIHGGVGTDGCYDVGRIVRTMRRLAPDIAAIQEVDGRHGPLGESLVHECLQKAVGDHGHVAWSVAGKDGSYGQILASRLPLQNRQVHDISVTGREPRKVLEATALSPAGPLRIIATHLGLLWRERRRQLGWLRDIILGGKPAATILLGDFNVIQRWPRAAPFRLFEQSAVHASFPSVRPLFALDRIYCRAGARIVSSMSVPDISRASDHLPVLARVCLDRED
jgi:endonuclease/exonuclease/phosphatase family metal-dependent hydrolase